VGDYKERLEAKAMAAVKKGLDCPDDPGKQGNLGATALKGLGIFEGEQKIGMVISLAPSASWQSHYTGKLTVVQKPGDDPNIIISVLSFFPRKS
jgi:hypothetical protein